MVKKDIHAELILASRNSHTKRILYTFKLTFPRIILAEVNTHRIASKNTSSSRAIPVPKMMRSIWNDPFVPIRWGTYQKGMQAGPELTGWKRQVAIGVWKMGRLFDLAEAWIDHYILHLSKEITNRIYERYVWTEQLFSTTDVTNLLHLRNHWMAEPHFQVLARRIDAIVKEVNNVFETKDCTNSEIAVKCQELAPGQWHLPYVGLWNTLNISSQDSAVSLDNWKQISAGRCAWVSYFMPGTDSQKMDNHMAAIDTFRKLAMSDPKHLSPLEHQATPLPSDLRCGNFLSFLQFRKEIPEEAGGDAVLPSITGDFASWMITVKHEEPEEI